MLVKNLLIILSSVLFFGSESCESLRILGVYPMTSRSHMNMFGSLMKELALRGHQVDVVSMFPLKKPMVNYTDYVFDTDISHFAPNGATFDDIWNWRTMSMSEISQICGDIPCSLMDDPSFQKILKTKKGAYDVIVLEIFMSNCYIALGKYLGAPVVTVMTMRLPSWYWKHFGNDFNAAYIPTVFTSSSQYMNFWQRLQNAWMVNSLELQVDHNLESQKGVVEKHFGRKLNSIAELYGDIALMLVNSHHSLDDITPLTPDVINVAGLHVEDDTQVLTPEIKKWLDDSTDGCVYFTLGSMVRFETLPRTMQENFYEMFRRIAPVRVLTKIVNASQLAPGLPKNVFFGPWLPQIPILKHKNVKVFITHGGMMGTQESIAHRVPMVGIPLFGDQFMNIEAYVRRGIAVSLDFGENTLTADALTDAVKAVLYDPSYRRNVERLSDLFMDRPTSALDTAVYWVEFAARHGGVLKSPATRLSWWQLKLLDVYGFLSICALLALYLAWRICSLLWRFVRFFLTRNQTSEKKLN